MVELLRIKNQFEEDGTFSLDASDVELIPRVLEGCKTLGNIQEIIGYEPDNYYLESAYLYQNEVFVSSSAIGNGWLSVGRTDQELADEILNCVYREELIKRNKKIISLPNPNFENMSDEQLEKRATILEQTFNELFDE